MSVSQITYYEAECSNCSHTILFHRYGEYNKYIVPNGWRRELIRTHDTDSYRTYEEVQHYCEVCIKIKDSKLNGGKT